MTTLAIFGPDDYNNRSEIFSKIHLACRLLGVHARHVTIVTSTPVHAFGQAVHDFCEEFSVSDVHYTPLTSASTPRHVVEWSPDVVVLFVTGGAESSPIVKILNACQKANIEPAVFDV